MYIIDAHNHPYYHGMNFEKMIANMDENGISKTWLLSWECPADEYDPNTTFAFSTFLGDTCPVSFRHCWEFKQRAPERFILGFAPDPRKPACIQRLCAAISNCQVQVCGEVKFRMMYDNPDAIDMYRFCGENGLPVIMHFDNAGATCTGHEFPRRHWWYGGDIDTLERVLKLCPETNFLGHAPGFWCHISGDDRGYTEAYPTGPVLPDGKVEKLLETYTNLYCDCSAGSCLTAFSRDPAYTRKLIMTYPDRFLFARDYHDNRLHTFLNTLDLPENVYALLCHGNAERLISSK